MENVVVCSHELLEDLKKEQYVIRECVSTSNSRIWQKRRRASVEAAGSDEKPWTRLKYIGGLDLSCPKNHQSRACGALVVISLPTLEVVYKDYIIDSVHLPYVPGFLGAREYPIMARLLDRIRQKSTQFYPQVLLVDGNGILHPMRCGSACYVGVREHIPTIGVAKNLFRMSGWKEGLEREIQGHIKNYGETFDLIHQDTLLGQAVIASATSAKPIFVSVGHDIDLATAVWVVKLCTKFRIPEPIRQADLFSREIVRSNGI